jgi:hypothetical protein
MLLLLQVGRITMEHPKTADIRVVPPDIMVIRVCAFAQFPSENRNLDSTVLLSGGS